MSEPLIERQIREAQAQADQFAAFDYPYTAAMLRELIAEVRRLQTTTEELSRQAEFDRTAVAECMAKANRAIDGRHWLTEGRGPYEWNDDKWHEEFYAAAVEIKAAIEPMTKIAANWKNCPQSGEEIAKARIDLNAELARERQRAEAAEAVANHPAILDLLISAVGHFQEQGKATVANIYDDLRLRILKLNPVPAIKEPAMPDDLYARALALLDDVERAERERWALEKLEAGIFPALRLLRALLEERRSMMATVATVAMLNAAIRVVRELHPDVAELWAEQVKQAMSAISMTDAALREFAQGTAV